MPSTYVCLQLACFADLLLYVACAGELVDGAEEPHLPAGLVTPRPQTRTADSGMLGVTHFAAVLAIGAAGQRVHSCNKMLKQFVILSCRQHITNCSAICIEHNQCKSCLLLVHVFPTIQSVYGKHCWQCLKQRKMRLPTRPWVTGNKKDSSEAVG